MEIFISISCVEKNIHIQHCALRAIPEGTSASFEEEGTLGSIEALRKVLSEVVRECQGPDEVVKYDKENKCFKYYVSITMAHPDGMGVLAEEVWCLTYSLEEALEIVERHDPEAYYDILRNADEELLEIIWEIECLKEYRELEAYWENRALEDAIALDEVFKDQLPF